MLTLPFLHCSAPLEVVAHSMPNIPQAGSRACPLGGGNSGGPVPRVPRRCGGQRVPALLRTLPLLAVLLKKGRAMSWMYLGRLPTMSVSAASCGLPRAGWLLLGEGQRVPDLLARAEACTLPIMSQCCWLVLAFRAGPRVLHVALLFSYGARPCGCTWADCPP